jgi:parvulin-like peptidyl-prolyl isomerase|tara:strand:- start:2423 stop:2743 length:321 start_codon:yes stop_codon:yes gene_type:complete
MKFKCKHILLSYDKSPNSTHERPLGAAVADAEKLIIDLKKGDITWDEAAAKHSACASGPRHGGDLGWQEEQHFHPDFSEAVKVIGIDTIGPPVISPWGVHIVLRTG